MKPGDCINIPTGVKYWHGAAPDEWFSHLAIEVPGENSSNEWLEPISDEEYRKTKIGIIGICGWVWNGS
jgi:4-carboxymuconolactone decarboxylase